MTHKWSLGEKIFMDPKLFVWLKKKTWSMFDKILLDVHSTNDLTLSPIIENIYTIYYGCYMLIRSHPPLNNYPF